MRETLIIIPSQKTKPRTIGKASTEKVVKDDCDRVISLQGGTSVYKPRENLGIRNNLKIKHY